MLSGERIHEAISADHCGAISIAGVCLDTIVTDLARFSVHHAITATGRSAQPSKTNQGTAVDILYAAQTSLTPVAITSTIDARFVAIVETIIATRFRLCVHGACIRQVPI